MNKYIVPILLLLLFSCDYPISAPVESPNDPNGENEIPIEEILFEYSQEHSDYIFKTNDSRYIGFEGNSIWKLSQTSENEMTSFEADVYKTSGDQAGGFGLIFCASTINSFFFIEIDTNQGYLIGKVTEGSAEALSEGWDISDALKPGFGVKNKIKIEYVGSQKFDVYFNDEMAIQIEDTNTPFFTGGRYGFIADVTPNDDFPLLPVECHFDPSIEMNW